MRTPHQSKLVEKYINERIGQELEPGQIADAVSCTVQTVYKFIRENSDRFTKVKRGIYKIVASNTQTFSNNQ